MKYGLRPIIGEVGGMRGILGWTVTKRGKNYLSFYGKWSKDEALAWIHQRTTQVWPGLAGLTT